MIFRQYRIRTNVGRMDGQTPGLVGKQSSIIDNYLRHVNLYKGTKRPPFDEKDLRLPRLPIRLKCSRTTSGGIAKTFRGLLARTLL